MNDYRLDIATDRDPDFLLATHYFEARDGDSACRKARRIVVAHGGPADRYGDLYEHDGLGKAVYYATVDTLSEVAA